MFGEKLSANKALEIGLVDQIVDSKNQLIEESLKKARFLFKGIKHGDDPDFRYGGDGLFA